MYSGTHDSSLYEYVSVFLCVTKLGLCVQWFKEKLQKLEQLESTLGKLHAAFETLVQHRRGASRSRPFAFSRLYLLSSLRSHLAISLPIRDRVREAIERSFTRAMLFATLLYEYPTRLQ